MGLKIWCEEHELNSQCSEFGIQTIFSISSSQLGETFLIYIDMLLCYGPSEFSSVTVSCTCCFPREPDIYPQEPGRDQSRSRWNLFRFKGSDSESIRPFGHFRHRNARGLCWLVVKSLGIPMKSNKRQKLAIPTGHFQDVAGVLDADGVAIRAGHHCAQPLHRQRSASQKTVPDLGAVPVFFQDVLLKNLQQASTPKINTIWDYIICVYTYIIIYIYII